MKTNNLNNILKTILFSLSVFLIEINNSFAQDNIIVSGSKNFKTTVNSFTDNVLTSLTTALMTGAFVIFFYGVVRFIYDRSSGDDARLAKDKEAMLWGLGALFVMVSTWGIIKMFQGFLGIQGDSNIQIKSVQFLSPTVSGGGSDTVDPSAGVTGGKKDFDTKKYNSCKGGSNNDCGSGLICQGSSGVAKTGETGKCVSEEESNTTKLEKAANGDLIINPFADQTAYPVVKVGSMSDLKATASGDGKAFTLLINLLKNKKCTEGEYNGKTYKLNSGFGTTYSNEDLSFVKKFQKINGLTDDGVVGKGTWEALLVNTGQKTTFTGITVKDCK